MAYETDFNELLTQSLKVRTLSSVSAGGAPTFSGSTSTFSCRAVKVNKFVRDAQGGTKQATDEVWVASTGTFAASSRYELPDGSTPPLLYVTSYPDEDGAHHHQRLMFGAR